MSITGAGYVQLVLKDQDGGDGTDSYRLAALVKADVDAGKRRQCVCDVDAGKRRQCVCVPTSRLVSAGSVCVCVCADVDPGKRRQ